LPIAAAGADQAACASALHQSQLMVAIFPAGTVYRSGN